MLSHFVALFAALLAFLTAIMIGISLKSVYSLEKETVEKSGILAEETKDLIDAHLGQIDRILTRFERSPSTRAFLLMPPLRKGSPDLSIVIDVFNDLREYRIRNDFVRSVILFSRRSDIAVSSEMVYLDFPEEYERNMNYAGYSYPEFSKSFLEGNARMKFAPSACVLSDGAQASVVLCVNSLPLGSGRAELGVVIAEIDESRLAGLLESLYGARKGGGALLLDANGQVLSAVGSAKAREAAVSAESLPGTAASMGGASQAAPRQRKIWFGGEEWLVSSAQSGSFGFTIVSAAPRSLFASNMNGFMRFTLAIGVGFSVLAAILAYFITLRNVKPLLDIAETTSKCAPGAPGKDLVVSIKEDIRRLADEKENLEAVLERRRPMMRQNVLRDLLDGELSAGPDLEKALADSGIGIDLSGAFCSVYASLAAVPEGGRAKYEYSKGQQNLILLQEKAEDRWKGRAYACGLGSACMAILFSLEAEGYNRFLEDIEDFHLSLRDIDGMEVYLACGRLAADVQAIPASFRDARRLVEYLRDCPAGRHIFVNPRRIPVIRRTCAYSIETESRIIQAARAGNTATLDAILSDLVDGAVETAGKRGAEVPFRRLAAGIEGTLYRLLDADRPEIRASGGDDVPLSDEGKLLQAMDRLREYARGQASLSSHREADLARRLEAYLEHRYPDPGLNLAMAAEDFGKKETWLYEFFRKDMGGSFSSRLESLRVEKAKQLLAEETVSVEDVAYRTGYMSGYSFRRAFKRRVGATPAEFRSTARKG